MIKFNLTEMLKTVQTSAIKHSPEILTGIGIAGMISTVAFAVKATPKAMARIEDKKDEECTNKLTVVETVKATWTCYIPAAVTGTMSTICLIGASSVNLRRNAALATAYTLSESAMREYKDKVVETVGEKKEKTVRDAIAKDRIDNDPVSNHEIVVTEKGNTLCYDVLSGRYFKSDIDKIKKAVNEINSRMLNQNYISLNEFYGEIGLSPTKIGNEIGWVIDQGLVRLDFSSHIAEDGTPCIVLDYETMPQYDFDRFL